MIPTRIRSWAGLFLLLLASGLLGQERISYAVSITEPSKGVFAVAMTIKEPSNPLRVRIPAWCPGWYNITRYQDAIAGVTAKAGGAPLPITHPDERVWQVTTGGAKTVVVEYEVKGNDKGFGFFGCHLENRVGFVNPPALCMYPEGRTQEPVSISFKVPMDWKIATAAEEASQPNSYKAADYDELVDMPFVLGHFRRVDFTAAGVPMFATFTFRDTMKADSNKIVSELKRVSETLIPLMGGAPMKRYHWNILLSGENFNGGLEHRSSTTLAVGDRDGLSIPGLAAHEMFHLWNVKRVRPKILGPFDYTCEQRTKNLWFAEGVTSYYADICLYRAKFTDKDGLLGAMLGQINQLQNCGDRLKYSAEDASWHGWEGGSQGYGNLSYYNKGEVLGFLFDMAIRTKTGGKKSLDDVMRLLMKKHNPPKPGYDEDGILTAINEVTGSDFTDLYNRLARSVEELPYGEILSAAGLVYSGATGGGDVGCAVSLPGAGAYPRVETVAEDGAAKLMGLLVGDVIVRVDDKDVRGQTAPFDKLQAGDTFTVEALRRGSRLKMAGTARARAAGGTTLTVAPNPSQAQKAVVEGWLQR